MSIALSVALSGCDEESVDCGADGRCADAGRDAAIEPMDAGAMDGSTAVADAGRDAAGSPADASADGGEDASSPSDADTDGGVAADGGLCVDPAPGDDRPTAPACSACRPTGDEPGPSGATACETHAECTDGANGRCVRAQVGTFCSYDECFVDDDCEADEVCSCDGATVGDANSCVPANCRVNADCASGRCAPTYGCLLGGPPTGWYCTTSDDECSADADCNVDGGPAGGRCAYDTTAEHWACAYGICVF